MRSGWLSAGAYVAPMLRLAVAVLFALNVGQIAGYDGTYGPFAAAVGVMMWLCVSSYVVLMGAQIDAEAERRGAI